VGHRQILQGEICSYDFFRSITDEDYSYIRFKLIKINSKYIKNTKYFLDDSNSRQASGDGLFHSFREKLKFDQNGV